jgi:outer membrane protein OmpA-like peptidoglycan-associated protein
MKNLKIGLLAVLLGSALIVMGCSTKTQTGAVVGTASGAAIGTIAGKAAGNTALGAIIGATVGGTAGAIIGRQMDKQAEEIKAKVPDAEVVRVEEGIVVEFSNSVLFGFDQSTLSNEARKNLDKMVTVLNTYEDTDIVVQGHTDSSGSEKYNQNLSEERARRVATYLASEGISSSRLSTIGFGEMLPKYLNSTEDGREKNRRVEFTISANEEMRSRAEEQAGK